MTICVAAMCDGPRAPCIIGAADRMITAGDIEFEPEQPKINYLTSAISVMVAGDSALQTEIIRRVAQDVTARITAEPKNWWKVEDVADLYSRYCKKARLKIAENGILAPLGLDHEAFIVRQKQMDSDLVVSWPQNSSITNRHAFQR